MTTHTPEPQWWPPDWTFGEFSRRLTASGKACRDVPIGFLEDGKINPLIAEATALSVCEREYRRCHDLYGRSDMRTGRAWDAMRRAGDRLRTLLSEIPAPADAEKAGG